MTQLVGGYSNQEVWEKCEYEGIEYFFLDYMDADQILDPQLKEAVKQLQSSMEIIRAIVSKYEPEEE